MAPITNQPLLQAEATLAAETNKRVVNRSIPTAIAKQAEGWRTGRTGAGRTRERPCARSTKKQWGASARIAHHGRAPSTDAAVRGRIYVSSRTSSPKNGVLATGEGSIYGRSTTGASSTDECKHRYERPALRPTEDRTRAVHPYRLSRVGAVRPSFRRDHARRSPLPRLSVTRPPSAAIALLTASV